MEEPKKIYGQISAIMADIEPISKDRNNAMQGYKFRGIDDVYNMVQPVFAKHKVFSSPTVISEIREERKTKSGGALIYTILKVRYDFYTDDGSCVSCVTIGEAMDSGDKSSNKAMSAAQKYAYLQVLNIPTDDPKDTENENPNPTPKPPANQKPIAPRAAASKPPAAKQTKTSANPDTISDDQRKRLWAIANGKDWDKDHVKDLIGMYGYESTNDIKKTDYEAICNDLESK